MNMNLKIIAITIVLIIVQMILMRKKTYTKLSSFR